MPEGRDPIFRWIGALHGWAFVICLFATIAGFAILAAVGGLTPSPPATFAP